MVEETENKSKTSIWWDIENCHVPKDVDPHYIAQNMTSALQRANLTGPIEIQVFGDTTILPHITQKALSDTGITLNHVPRGNKDAADKAILVGMLLWALDNPPPANILLISGDGDFANALHRLRLKTYSILLAIPAQFVKPALTGAAKKLWFWKDMAKGQLAEPEGSQPISTSSSQELSASRSMDVFPKRQASSSLIDSVVHSSASPQQHTTPQKRMNMSEQFSSLSLESHPISLSSENKSISCGSEDLFNHVSDRKVSAAAGTNSPFSRNANRNTSYSQPPVSAACSVDFGQFPHFLPQPTGRVDSFSSAPLTNGVCGSKPPSMQVGPLPRGPLKHIAPNNNRDINSTLYGRNSVPENKVNYNMALQKYDASEYQDPKVVSSPYRPTATSPPSSVATNNLDKLPHDTCLDKIYSAMKTLERDMLAPTEGNLSDCIRYWDPQYEKIDVKQTLKTAGESRQVTRTQLGGGLIMYFPPKHRVPWNCVDPGNMNLTHSGDVWLELQRFLLYGDKKQAFLSSSSRYHAALLLKNSCGTHIKNLVVGKILNLLQQAMQERRWLRRTGPFWGPLVSNQKVLLDWSAGESERPKTTTYPVCSGSGGVWKPAVPANAERALDKDAVLTKLRSFLSQTLRTGNASNLSFLPKDFELATGTPLDYQKMGYTNLFELIKGLSDMVYVETTDSGLSLLRPVKVDGNLAAVGSNNMGDKENDEKAVSQLQLVQELKLWLSYLMINTKDGYDVSRIHQDFLQATGKDLSKEGLDFYKLNSILTQLQDVINIVESPVGQWLAYPVNGRSDAASKYARGVTPPVL